jgi:hypothetical protein
VTARGVLALALAAGGGFLAGLAVRPPSPREAIVESRLERPLVTCTATLSPGDVEALKQAVVAALPPDRRAEAAPAPPAADSAAAASAAALVDEAITAGEWTDEHAARLRGLLAGMRADERAAILSTLTVSLNDGRLRSRARGIF